MSPRVVVVGDAFVDVDVDGQATRLCPDEPVPVVAGAHTATRPGGAGLVATIAATSGCDTTLVTGGASDRISRVLDELLGHAGVTTLRVGPARPTVEKTRIRAGGRTLVRVDTEDAPTREGPARWSGVDVVEAVLREADAIVVADYGRGLLAVDGLRALVARAATRRPVVWDPHPDGVAPVRDCWAVTPNHREAFSFASREPSRALGAIRSCAEVLRRAWESRAVAITLDRDGVLVETGSGLPLVIPVTEPTVGDTCGAGDAFAVGLALACARHEVLSDAAVTAVDVASRFVASGGAGSLGSERAATEAPTAQRGSADRAARVVAAGGCFDVLHVGHVQLLQRARRLGDRLVVLLNSDASVRALKGPPRPVVREDERAAVLRALGCVDEVRVFDERTPEAALRELRPDVFVKGGDYARAPLPEQTVLEEWGGQVVILPYVAGRSTTRLLQEATRHDPDLAR